MCSVFYYSYHCTSKYACISCTATDTFNVEYRRDLEMWVIDRGGRFYTWSQLISVCNRERIVEIGQYLSKLWRHTAASDTQNIIWQRLCVRSGQCIGTPSTHALQSNCCVKKHQTLMRHPLASKQPRSQSYGNIFAPSVSKQVTKIIYKSQLSKYAPVKSRCADEIGERYGKLSISVKRCYSDGVVQAVTFAYLICCSVSCISTYIDITFLLRDAYA